MFSTTSPVACYCLDKEVRLRAFNHPMKTIFTNKKDEELLYRYCGEAIGCAYQVEEQKECGTTSQCQFCELRKSALTSYVKNEVVFRDHIIRAFMDSNNNKIDKHLQFSTRLFQFNRDKYVIMLIEDISKFYEPKKPTE
ncbi:MAG: hypothetical protein HC906_19730 [Bacteroidales bacterium]|nr:hypothetical protein [Bacteroidales bacterium]